MDEELKQKFEVVKAAATPTAVGGLVVRFVAKHSVGFIAAKLAKTYCPTENKKQELQVQVGAYVIGGMAGDAAADWAINEFNEAVDTIKGFIGRAKDADEPSEEITPEESTE